MQILQRTERAAAGVAARAAGFTMFVDCADRARQDLLVYWLARAGFRVHEGPLPAAPGPGIDGEPGGVLLTDRFGPGLDHEVTIFQRKAQRPGLRVIVVGSGDGGEAAQLSLARAAGADATLPASIDRDSLLALLSRWT